MHNLSDRRTFIRKTTTAGTLAMIATKLPILSRAQSPNSRVRVGIMGTNGRGMAHVSNYLNCDSVEIAYVCDVDSRALAKGLEAVGRKQAQKPKGITDVRQMLDDASL